MAQATFTSGAMSTAQAVGSTVAATRLAFAQHCTVYSGSTSGKLMVSLTSATDQQVSFDYPAQSTGAGLWVVPASTSVSAVVHYF